MDMSGMGEAKPRQPLKWRLFWRLGFPSNPTPANVLGHPENGTMKLANLTMTAYLVFCNLSNEMNAEEKIQIKID